MAITKLQPFNLNSTADYTFANVTTTNANLGNAATANYFIGSGNNLSNIQGSNVTGAVANAIYADSAGFADTAGYASTADTAGTVTTSSQPNITSTGTLTSLNVSGNANVGNLGTTNLVATGAGSFGANVNMNGNWINNVGYPSATTDVATKSYVDTMISSGISYHQPVAVATTTTLSTATGGTTAYNSPNGASNGIGAYISTTGTYLNIDGANVQTVGTRILVKDEANATWNGIYTYANTTAIVRSTDTDEYGPDSTEQLSINDYFFVQGGTVNRGIAYIVSAPAGTITFGTSNITFSQFSSSQVYSAGTGLTLTGTTFSVNASQSQITSVGTLSSLTVSGNITGGNLLGPLANGISNINIPASGGNIAMSVAGNANIVTITGTGANVTGNLSATYFIGNGAFLTGVDTSPANISNGTSNVNIPALNGNITMSVAGNANIMKITGTGANITGYANITGNVNATYFIGNGAFLTGVDTSPANISNGTSNVTVTSLNGNITMSVAGNANIMKITGTGVNVAGYANITGNVNAPYFIGNGAFLTGVDTNPANISNGTSNVNIPASGGNITMGVAGNANIAVITGTGANINGTLKVTGQSNLGAVANVVITGGTSGYLLQTDGAGNLSWTAITTSSTLANGNSSVNIPSANGNVNISAVGNANVVVVTGTGANINGTLKVTGQSNLGAVANVVITGGSSGYILQTDGAGNLSWIAISTNSSLANGNSNVNIPSANGNVNISAVGNANVVIVTGTGANINGTLKVTGQSNLGSVGNVVITGGTSGYVLQTDGAGTLSWVAQSGSGGSSISNGNSNVNIATANGNVTITAVGNTTMTITGTGANITGTANITGNVNAPFFIGNGSALTGIGGAGYIFNGTSNANIATTNGNLVVGINGTAAIATFSNLGVNVTGYMTATGNVTGGNLLGPLANGNSNVRIATSNGNVTITAVGNTTMTVTGTGANIAGYANITGNVNAPFFIGNGSALTGIGGAGYIFNGTSNANIATSGGNLNIGIGGTANVGIFTSTGLNVAGYANITGNVNASYFIGNGFYLSGIDAAGRVVNGTSNLQILQNSNLTISVNGNANIMTVTGTGANIAGYVTATGNISGGNISASGQLISTQATGTAPLVVLSTTQVANLNSSLAGSVTTNAQPNITSVGNLNGLIVSNSTSTVNLSNTANVTLGAVANLHISGGSANYVLKTDGSGNLDWVAVGGISVISSISNGNSNVNIATSNGNVTLTAVGNTTMTVTGTGANIVGYANITGNVTLSGANVNLGDVGNLRIAGGASSYVLSTDGASNLSWIAQSGGGGASSAIQEFSATAGQTTFTVVGGYQVGSVLVFVNGIQMNNGDYTATNGSTVILSEPRLSGDVVRILSSMASPAININSLQNFSVAMSIALGI